MVSIHLVKVRFHILNTNTSKNHVTEITQTLSKKLWWLCKKSLFLVIRWWQQKHIPQYRRGIFFFNFSNNVAKTCSYKLKISRNIKIKYVFHFKAYFHVLDTFHASCLSALNPKPLATHSLTGWEYRLPWCNMQVAVTSVSKKLNIKY